LRVKPGTAVFDLAEPLERAIHRGVDQSDVTAGANHIDGHDRAHHDLRADMSGLVYLTNHFALPSATVTAQ
jgi:hypothetical protein